MKKEKIIEDLKYVEDMIDSEWPMDEGESIYDSEVMVALEEAIAIIKADSSEYNEDVTRAIDSSVLLNKLKEEKGKEYEYYVKSIKKDDNDEETEIKFNKVKTEEVISINRVIDLIDGCATIPVVVNKYIKA